MMSFIGFIPENHDWCLKQLLKRGPEILKHFPDLLPELLGPGYTIADILLVMSHEFVRFGFACMPMATDFDAYLFWCATSFADRQAFGTAFAIAVMALLQKTSKERYFEAALAWRKKIEENPKKYEKELRLFEPILKKVHAELKKPGFYYLDAVFDDRYCFYLSEKNVKHEERTDYRLNFMRKRWQLQWLPNGKWSQNFFI